MPNQKDRDKFKGCEVVMEHALAIIWFIVVVGMIAWLTMRMM